MDTVICSEGPVGTASRKRSFYLKCPPAVIYPEFRGENLGILSWQSVYVKLHMGLESMGSRDPQENKGGEKTESKKLMRA